MNLINIIFKIASIIVQRNSTIRLLIQLITSGYFLLPISLPFAQSGRWHTTMAKPEVSTLVTSFTAFHFGCFVHLTRSADRAPGIAMVDCNVGQSYQLIRLTNITIHHCNSRSTISRTCQMYETSKVKRREWSYKGWNFWFCHRRVSSATLCERKWDREEKITGSNKLN